MHQETVVQGTSGLMMMKRLVKAESFFLQNWILIIFKYFALEDLGASYVKGLVTSQEIKK